MLPASSFYNTAFANKMSTPVCSECRDPTAYMFADHHTGDHVCSVCGVVSGRLVTGDKEWREFEDSGGPSQNRVGDTQDQTLSASLQTYASGSAHDAQGKQLRTPGRKTLATTAEERMDKRQLRLNAIINKIALRLHLGAAIVADAKKFSLLSRNIGINRLQPEAVALVQIACKKHQSGIAMNVLAAAAELESVKMAWKIQGKILTKIEFARRNKNVTEMTPLQKGTNTQTHHVQSKPVSIAQCPIPAVNRSIASDADTAKLERARTLLRGFPRRLSVALQLTYREGTTVERTCIEAVAKGVHEGTRPSTIAAAVAWLAFQRSTVVAPKSLKQAASALGVSPSTLRKVSLSILPDIKAMLDKHSPDAPNAPVAMDVVCDEDVKPAMSSLVHALAGVEAGKRVSPQSSQVSSAPSSLPRTHTLHAVPLKGILKHGSTASTRCANVAGLSAGYHKYAMLKSLPRKRVSWGHLLAPELFNSHAPPCTPVRRGMKPANRGSFVRRVDGALAGEATDLSHHHRPWVSVQRPCDQGTSLVHTQRTPSWLTFSPRDKRLRAATR